MILRTLSLSLPIFLMAGLGFAQTGAASATPAVTASTYVARIPVAVRRSSTSSTTSLDQISENWAGLVQEGKPETSVSASWTVPTSFASTPSAQSAVAEWVGLGGVNTSSLLQVGTITTPNQQGDPVTTVFWEKLPSAAVEGATVAAGKTVTASITPVSGTTDKWTVALVESGSSTPLISHTVTLSATQSQAIETSADWITEAPSTNNSRIVPLAPVESTTMTNLMADGQALAAMPASSLVTIGLQQGPTLVAAPTVNISADTLTVNTIYGTLAPSPGSGDGPGSGFPGSGFPGIGLGFPGGFPGIGLGNGFPGGFPGIGLGNGFPGGFPGLGFGPWGWTFGLHGAFGGYVY
ncbi:MAG: hypothetical protein C7B45_13205 [Sulfobacillus acidophilus]|uniref:Uncharacterized protein n=1 Tax=Sulfobacillus acidophilus TaxID=53633 RepID=A0A2T2WF20_9FIRM|nr:MAG: hypothetical protein C7B45_13205 [Sulfobacillus acidophilus]